MLFHSAIFLGVFLPLVFGGFCLLHYVKRAHLIVGWLVLASLVFYGYWYPPYLVLITVSILVNYGIGKLLTSQKFHPKIILSLGVTVNLLFLGYFKYAYFFASTLGVADGYSVLQQIVLPIGISFYTFQQIAYLVDAYRGKAVPCTFLQYCLFVTFFPQLIAGPIVHHADVLPQFSQNGFRLRWDNLSVGLTIFVIGLFKKVVLADSIAPYADIVFGIAEIGGTPIAYYAWGGAIAFGLQLYLDFSGYADMAIGLGRLFDIRLPLNFDSPYKATSIVDFWRRWHITLSRFLRDYLYIPLGGSKRGLARTFLNIMITFLLGGLWHGAGWTFVLWGALHGIAILANHLWRSVTRSYAFVKSFFWGFASRILVLLFVIVAWVPFRAESMLGALRLLHGMTANTPIGLMTTQDYKLKLMDIFGLLTPEVLQQEEKINILVKPITWEYGWHWIVVGALFVLLAPSTQQLLRRFSPAYEQSEHSIPSHVSRLEWGPTLRYACFVGLLSVICLTFLVLQQERPFLYFQF